MDQNVMRFLDLEAAMSDTEEESEEQDEDGEYSYSSS